MSQFPDEGNVNPFVPPQSLSPRVPVVRSNAGLPTFCKVMFILDLIFCFMRLPLVLFAIPGYFALRKSGDPMLQTVVYEIATGAGIVVSGFAADILMLMRSRSAATLGWFCLAVTLASFGVGCWQANLQLARMVPGSPQMIGGFVGLGLVLTVRATLLLLYAIAISKFSQWAAKRQHGVAPGV